jgi:hypothetical protein
MNQKTNVLLAGIIAIVVIGVGAGFFWFNNQQTNQILEPNSYLRVQQDVVLQPDELEYGYHIDDNGSIRYSQNQIILERGQVEGKQYILDTGYVDGWKLRLARNRSQDITPSIFESSTQVYETVGGATLAFDPKNFYKEVSSWDLDSTESCDLGNDCRLESYARFDPVTNLTEVRYDVTFRYHNVVNFVSGRGLEIETNAEIVLDAAQTVANKLADLELTKVK